MARLRFKDIDDGTVSVSYRASADPQLVHFRGTRIPGARSPFDVAGDYIGAINRGLGGGAEFSPTASQAALVTPVPDAVPEAWSLDIRMESVSPLFVMHMVVVFAAGSESLSVAGDLRPDGSSLSLTDADVRDWWDRPQRHLRAWGTVPFVVEESEISRGAAIRVRFQKDLPEGYVSAPYSFGYRLLEITSLLHLSHTEGGRKGTLEPAPKRKQAKREISASWAYFDVTPAAFQALVTNMLIWVHEKEHPIESVQIQTP